jgi:very-short-patch-repair endonuclease
VKTYPVILYPKVIIKFLAENPTPTLNSYQPKKSVDKVSTPVKSQVRVTTFKDDKWKWLLLRVIPFKDSKWIWLLLFFVGFIAVFSSTFLSPRWLVAIAWSLIFMGVTYYLCSFNKAVKNYNTVRKNPLNHANNKKNTGVVLRCQEREQQLLSLLTNSVIQSSGISHAQQGVSEKNFYQVLQRIFPNVVQGLEFKNTNYHPYSADFALLHESGLSIDIEIDEPYVGNTKEPHHCIDQGKDDIRNEFFTSGNWVVVRFSEKQAVQHPQSCCKVIAKVVAQLSGDYTYYVRLQALPDLLPDSMWTIKQARKWAKQNYRKTYLNPPIISNSVKYP